jgi:signal transduction histidine kinase
VVTLTASTGEIALRVADDGRGLPPGAAPERFEREGHMGLAGMRERLSALGGTVTVGRSPIGGLELLIRLPLPVGAAA